MIFPDSLRISAFRSGLRAFFAGGSRLAGLCVEESQVGLRGVYNKVDSPRVYLKEPGAPCYGPQGSPQRVIAAALRCYDAIDNSRMIHYNVRMLVYFARPRVSP